MVGSDLGLGHLLVNINDFVNLSSSGEYGVELDDAAYQEFRSKGLNILSMNECQDLGNQKLSETEKVKEANDAIKLYLSGKSGPEWRIFYYSYDCPENFRKKLFASIVERGVVSDLVNK